LGPRTSFLRLYEKLVLIKSPAPPLPLPPPPHNLPLRLPLSESGTIIKSIRLAGQV
jgi:hypothetical protein